MAFGTPTLRLALNCSLGLKAWHGLCDNSVRMNGYSKSSLFLYPLAILPLFLFGCDSSSSPSGIRASTENYTGTWKLTKVNNTPITDQALLVIVDGGVSGQEALSVEGECLLGATLAESDGRNLYIIEGRSGCFVSFPKDASAQLAVHKLVYAGAEVSFAGEFLHVKDPRGNVFTFSSFPRE